MSHVNSLRVSLRASFWLVLIAASLCMAQGTASSYSPRCWHRSRRASSDSTPVVKRTNSGWWSSRQPATSSLIPDSRQAARSTGACSTCEDDASARALTVVS